MSIEIRRVYEDDGRGGGQRFLVDRLWPRGKRKDELRLDGWLKEVAPSDRLRHWFGHDPARWEEFVRRYDAELESHPDAWQPLLEAARRGEVTLLFGAKDEEQNNAVALKSYLEEKLKRRRHPRAAPLRATPRRSGSRRA